MLYLPIIRQNDLVVIRMIVREKPMGNLSLTSSAKRRKPMDERTLKTLQGLFAKHGFVDVTGMIEERKNDLPYLVAVEPEEKRNCISRNNGVVAIVDHFGHTWITPITVDPEQEEFFEVTSKLPLLPGRYVPFSNDMHYWVSQNARLFDLARDKSESLLRLREILTSFGFVDATGTLEGFGGDKDIVKFYGWSLSIDYNNGMHVVVDHVGHSWVAPARIFDDGNYEENIGKLGAALTPFKLTRGAHVPHSNDGGDWARSIWPWAYAEKTKETKRREL